MPLLLDDGDHSYVYGPSSTPIAQVDDSTSDVEYLHGDLLSSTRLITDDSAATVGSNMFDEYGTRTAHTGTADSAIGYTGNWTDPDTGLLYLRARDYDPATGQFLAVDPAVDATAQPYAYAGNNPLLRSDPTGLDWIQDTGDWLAGFADTVTFGGTRELRKLMGVDQTINQCSLFYHWGGVGGTFASFLPVGAPVKVIAIGADLARGGQGFVRSLVNGLKSLGKDAAESCMNSFPADTPVMMADNTQEPISQVKVGDKVLATDPETGETAARPVAALIRHSGEHTLVDLGFSDGSTLTSTDHHPFWDVSAGAFVDAIDLATGDRVLSTDGRILTVVAAVVYQDSLTAYNLEVAGIHTYYAGISPVLVHNSCGPIDALSNAGREPVSNGFTQAGQALQKHANRPQSDFPLPSGRRNPSAYNQLGQDVLDDLLTNPGTATRSYVHTYLGSVTEYWLEYGAARFNQAGKMTGFLDY